MSQISSSYSKNRFLLIRTDRIGDTILTLPAVTALRKKFPESFIAFLSRPYTLPLIEKYEGIDLLIKSLEQLDPNSFELTLHNLR